MKIRRSVLFMPGNNPSMLQNAIFFGADSVIFDLEDAVSLSEKDSARLLVREVINSIDFKNLEIIVRINSFDTSYCIEDIKEVCSKKPIVLMIPKVTAEDLSAISLLLDDIEVKNQFSKNSIKIFPIIETAYSLETISDILKSTQRIDAVLLGAEDLTADLAIERTKSSEEIFYARNRVVSICKAFRVDAIDTPFTDVEDFSSLEKDTYKAKSIGFTGKACINPRQISTVHKVFSPTKPEIEYANRVLSARDEAEKNNLGVFSLDGKMVDAPVINRALKILEQEKLINN